MQQEKLKILYYQHNKVLELFSTKYVYHQSNYVYIRSHHFPVSCLKMSEWMLVSLSGCWNLFNFTAQKYYNSWRCLMFAIALSCSVMQSLGSFLQIHGISWNLFVEPDFIYHCTYIALTVFDIFWLVKFLLNSSVHIYIQSFDHAAPNTRVLIWVSCKYTQ